MQYCEIIANLDLAVYNQILKIEMLNISHNYNTSLKQASKKMCDTNIFSLLDLYGDTFGIIEKGIGRTEVRPATHIINSGYRIELKVQSHKYSFVQQ